MKIDDWTLSGGGMEGESYFSKSHPQLMMKVYPVQRGEEFVKNEFRQGREMGRCGISVPEVLEVTHFKGQPALIMQRITHKKSFCRLVGECPEMIPSLARRMAAMTRDLHSKVPSCTATFPSALGKYRSLLESNTMLDDADKLLVREALDAIEADERETLLHGDLHFGNVITDGTADYFIDLGDVSMGHPNHDLAMFYIVTHFGCDHSFEFLYHMKWPQALEFWEEFKTAYYGHPIDDREVYGQLRNYMLARSVWFKIDQIQTTLCSLLRRDDRPLTAEIRLRDLGE